MLRNLGITPREEGFERLSWYTMLFITAVFFLIDHSLLASVNVSLYETTFAADKASAVGEGSFARRLSYLAFGLYGAISWLRTPQFRLKGRGLVAAMLLAYLGWAALSMAWSRDPMLTLRRLSSLGLLALGISGLLRHCSGEDVVRLILVLTLSYLLIGVGAEIALGTFSPWSAGYRFAGTLYPNVQGINCAALALSGLTLATASKRFRAALFTLAAVGSTFLALTGSRGALAAGIAALFSFWVLRTKPDLVVMAVLALGCLGLLDILLAANGVLPSPLGPFLAERVPGAGALSGRSDLWTILIDYARRRPLLGYGYGAFFDPQRGLELAAQVGTWAFGGPHSVYFGTLVDLGAIGLAWLLGILMGGVMKSIRVFRETLEPHYLLFTALLVFHIVDGISESEMLTPNWQLIPGLVVAFLAFRSRDLPGRSGGEHNR